jgi:hypothetical protein
VEGYICEFRKTWGVFRKTSRAGGGVDLVDQVGYFRSIGSESNGCGQRGAAGLDLATRFRSGGHGRVRALSGGAGGRSGDRRRRAAAGSPAGPLI